MKYKFDVYTQPDDKGFSKLVSKNTYPTKKGAEKARNALIRIPKGIHIVETNLPEFGKRITLQTYGGYRVSKIREIDE